MKNEKKEFPKNGEVEIPEWLADKYRGFSTKYDGIMNAIRMLSYELGNIQLDVWNWWKQARTLALYPPDDPDCKVWMKDSKIYWKYREEWIKK